MPDSPERAARLLRGPDGKRIYLQLLRIAAWIAWRYGWRRDEKGETLLPFGATPESIVHTVIEKVLEGQRTWQGDGEASFIIAAIGMIRSETSHIFEKPEAKVVEPIIQAERTDGSDDERDFASNDPSPEAQLLEQERETLDRTRYDLLLTEIQDDEELSDVVIALHDTHSPAEIAERTGIDIKRVYQDIRTLKRKAAAIRLPLVARAAKERQS